MNESIRSNSTKLCIVTVSGVSRMALSTQELVKDFSRRDNLMVYGLDGNSTDLNSFITKDSIAILQFIVGGELSSGELGCLLSHQYMYKHILDSNCDSALILEDDAKLMVDLEHLESIIEQCQKSQFDLVSFFSSGGGVARIDKNEPFRRSLVPSLGAVAYWINSTAAKTLLVKNYYLGLADWPISIAAINSALYAQEVFSHADHNFSIINNSHHPLASKRISVMYRNLICLLLPDNFSKLQSVIKEIGFLTVIKILTIFRIYRRVFRLLLRIPKGSNETLIIQPSKLIKKN
jgi:GR25 family glycosyltransferase involved in LPS biosynthesis